MRGRKRRGKKILKTLDSHYVVHSTAYEDPPDPEDWADDIYISMRDPFGKYKERIAYYGLTRAEAYSKAHPGAKL